MKTIFYFLFFISLLSLNSSVYAQTGDISKQEAVAIATKSNPGRVLSVKRKANVYQVKILSDSGKVRIIKVEAQNRTAQPQPRTDVQGGSRSQR